MRTQQQAEDAERQRIKSLVLNYDLRDEDQTDGEAAFHYALSPNKNRTRLVGKGMLNQAPVSDSSSQRRSGRDKDSSDFSSTSTAPTPSLTESTAFDPPHGQPRLDKAGGTRSKQRARKLQLGDIDWYGNRSNSASNSTPPPEQEASLDAFIIKDNSRRDSGIDTGSRRGRGKRSTS